MRIGLYLLAGVAALALAPPDALRSALATSAAALVEATPFALAGIVLARLVRRPNAVAFLGCGCGSGASARSLPAAAATWIVFGPLAAIGRLIAATIVARATGRRRCGNADAAPRSLLREIDAVLIPALMAGLSVQFAAFADPERAGAFVQAAFGAAFGFAAAPCGLGAIALAGALRARAPIAATAFLCVAGICDSRALAAHPGAHARGEHDPLAYLMLAAALAIVALRRGDALVHPILTAPLGLCALVALLCAVATRTRASARLRAAPALMLAGALIAAPPPVYRATQTTLRELFAGERLEFTGTLVRQERMQALVRYAITCCRADAAPIVVRLAHPLPYAAGTWLRAQGVVESSTSDLRLAVRRVERIAPPADPFVYR